MKITVVGTGYVGLVTGTCLADMGNTVTCHDIDQGKIARLKKGEIPIYEPGLEELVLRNYKDGRLLFSSDMVEAAAECEVCFIAVGTPSDQDGSADRRFVLDAAKSVAANAKGQFVLVVKSTVPVGTCDRVRDVVEETFKERGVDFKFDVVSNPEFLKEGKAIDDFMRPDRIVVGVRSDFGRDTMQKLYAPFVKNGRPLLLMDVRSSEMTKYAANVMLATRITLMNEIAQICERVGADVLNVRKGIGSDARIGMGFLYAGIGYGGSCFPKDVKALARLAVESDCSDDILEAVEKVNRHQKVLLANRVIARFNHDVKDKRFALWGIAFKPNTDDIREAPALAIIKRLTDEGASVCAHDPEGMENAKKLLAENGKVSFAADQYEALKGADALLLATEWGQYRSPDFVKIKALLKTPLIYDGRNQYEPEELQKMGFEYHGIGRGRV